MFSKSCTEQDGVSMYFSFDCVLSGIGPHLKIIDFIMENLLKKPNFISYKTGIFYGVGNGVRNNWMVSECMMLRACDYNSKLELRTAAKTILLLANYSIGP